MDEYQNTNFERSDRHTRYRPTPGKIFVGGISRGTKDAQFLEHFVKYGEIKEAIVLHGETGRSRGFGFVTYADPSVIDRVIMDTHIINGKQVEIKRAIPRSPPPIDFIAGGIPATVSQDELREFFSRFGEVEDQRIIRDNLTGSSRGFGYMTFGSVQCVDDLLTNGNQLDFAGTQVDIEKAKPNKLEQLLLPSPPLSPPLSPPPSPPSPPPSPPLSPPPSPPLPPPLSPPPSPPLPPPLSPPPSPPPLPPSPPPFRHQTNSGAAFDRGHLDAHSGYGGPIGGFGGDSIGARSYRSSGAYGGRASAYGGYGENEFGSSCIYDASDYGGFRTDLSLGSSNQFGGGGLGRGCDLQRDYGGSGGRASAYGGYGENEFGSSSRYDTSGYGGFRTDLSLGSSNRFGGGGLGRGYDLQRDYGGSGDSYAGFGGGYGGSSGSLMNENRVEYGGGGYGAGVGGAGGSSTNENRVRYGGGYGASVSGGYGNGSGGPANENRVGYGGGGYGDDYGATVGGSSGSSMTGNRFGYVGDRRGRYHRPCGR